MNRQLKRTAGVTLLEIMLVLAIGSMIILMSVRYYKSASASQQATAFLSQIQTITAAADNLAQGGTGYSAVTTGNVQNTLGGAAAMNTPWGAITIGTATATTYAVVYPTGIPTSVTTPVNAQLSANAKFTNLTATGYTFDSRL